MKRAIKYFYFNHHKHKFIYSKDLSGKNYRACKKCGVIEEYRENMPYYGSGWFRMVTYTKLGAKELLESITEESK